MSAKKTNYKQGFYKLQNPQKYKGDAENIVFRSGWEKRVFDWLDEHPQIVEWSSEEIIIPYISPVDNRMHRYFPDVYAKVQTNNGTIKEMLIEIKPLAQTKEPVKPKRKTKRYITEVFTYSVNQAKWAAARTYCEKKGWEFQIFTEAELFGKKDK